MLPIILREVFVSIDCPEMLGRWRAMISFKMRSQLFDNVIWVKFLKPPCVDAVTAKSGCSRILGIQNKLVIQL